MSNPPMRPQGWKPGSRRTKYERWVELLESCIWEIRTQSWLMRTLGLKTQMVKEDIQFLLDTGLLEQVDEPDEGVYVYKTTAKGRAALEQFYKLVTRFFSEPNKVGMFVLL